MSNTSKGIICIILSAFSFAAMALFVRLAGDIHFVEKAFFRNSVAFIIALILLFKDARVNGWESVKLHRIFLPYLILRSAAGSVGIFGNFYAVDHLVLSDAAILNKMSPFFAVLFSILLLKEKLKPFQLLVIMGAFAGALLIVKPSFDFSAMLPTLVGFAGGAGAGFAYACVRKLSSMHCNGKLIVVFFSAFSTLLSVPYLIFHWEALSMYQLAMLVCTGVCAAGGQFGITAAYYYAAAREISVYDYSQIIFSAAMGFIFFGMIPDWMSICGYVIIITMAVINFLYNRRLHAKE
ncbi:DMT family transporter [Treponema sp.]|uniref:DMT family transporter n=1 Tax=Treponema sp. TaxID=166 RepID=UPI0025E2C17C|nr:DMT family transporter [Treponema sp.]MCR5219027.1 DMT family transporter [Treponema sp.]